MNRETLIKILERARWAPSGDNTQPWRFEILADDRLRIHGFDTRDHVLYDFDGHPSHIAHGALLETLRIAATGFGLRADWQIRADEALRHPIYEVCLTAEGCAADPLLPFIEKRAVQRRPMAVVPLDAGQRAALAAAAGEGFRIRFFETFAERLKVAGLLWDNAHIRLTCPEAFPVHRDIIEWDVLESKDRIPAPAVGVDPLTLLLMRWVMKDWSRVHFFNRFLFGTLPPRLQLDWLPALRCSAHLLLCPLQPPSCLEDWLRLGMALQRVWLTVTQQGLYLQPEMTPVIFRWYVQAGKSFSAEPRLTEKAKRLAQSFEDLTGAARSDAFGFFCRIGGSSAPRSRSIRLDIERLMQA